MTTKHSHRTGRVVALAAAVAALAAPIVSVAATGAAPAKQSAQPAAATPRPQSVATRPAAMRMAALSFDLCADSGLATAPLPATLQVWGYTTDASCTAAVDKPGGPVITATVGDTVTINLHNGLVGENTSLLFQGQPGTQPIPPDTVGAAPGGTVTYTFTAANPGTYLYEAGLTANGQHQVAMGLYGAIVVLPATPGQAYNSATTAYDDEGVLVLGELDPALNNSANKANFDMRNFRPKYFTINGEAYSATDPIATTAGNTVLLRYVNAGMSYHSMAVLGASQEIIAYDGSPLTYPHSVAAETFGPGQTADALVDVSLATTAGSKFAVYDASLLLNNSTASGFGGMMTFIDVGTATTGPDTTGPATSAVTATPNPTNGSVDVALAATVSDVATGGGNVTAAEYFIDTAGANGSGTAMTGGFTSPTEAVSATIAAATVNGLSSGNHTVYVHGQDTLGNWGSFNFVNLNIDKTGPVVSGLTLNPNPSGGTNVAVHATGSDASTGGGTIAAAEYFVDPVGTPTDGTGVAMAVNYPLTTASLDATIAGPLGVGSHSIAVHAQDSLGNWGALQTISLVVDAGGPVTSAVSVSPSATNGLAGYNSTTPAVRVFATGTDSSSNVVAMEGFIDTVGANGTGFLLSPTDGAWDELSEPAIADIPLTTVTLLSTGTHTIYVHAKDATGSWGTTTSTALLVDKGAPTLSALTATAVSPTLTTSVTLGATAVDPAPNSGVSQVEWFTGTDPGAGLANAMTNDSGNHWTASIDTSTWATGTYTISVRARDVATNWTAIQTVNVTVSRGALAFSTSGTTNPPGVGGAADDADIYNWNGSFSRQFDMTAAPYNLPNNANVDGLAYRLGNLCLSFTGTVVVPGVGSVADEDVVCRNGAAWSLYFDGSAHGLATNTFDLDEIAFDAGGTLYFSTGNNSTPPGAGGAGDNADIYRWNGGSSYTRMVNASGGGSLGLPGTANVDGLAWVDSTHFYLSFAANTNVPGLGTVEDEDVVYYNAGVWSVWFDGTSLGLTAGNHDLDAIDV